MLDGVNLYLIGMMGAGKSTIGKLLAGKLGYQFFDTDTLIATATGKSISEIFAQDGEAVFREIEHQVLAELSTYTRLVVATGGGIVLQQMNWSHLRDGLVVWLDVPIAALYQRLSDSTEPRPLLQTENPRQVLEDILTQRRDRYAQADIQVCIESDEMPETTGDRILAAIAATIEPDRLKINPSLN